MAENKRLLTEAEAQQIAKNFLLAKYFDSKVEFDATQLITKDDAQVYQLHGKITMLSRGSVDRFIIHKKTNEHSFIIKVGAQQGQIINYELR